MEIRKINIDQLNPAPYNPRKDLKPGDQEYDKLKISFREFGYVEPIVWNKRTGNVVGGHQRLKILKEEGRTEIDCVIVDLEPEREKALNVALNKISGEWDMEKLKVLFEELETELPDIGITGFDLEEFNAVLGRDVLDNVRDDEFDADKAYEEIVEPVSKRGDIYILGRHRLMCGDSCMGGDVARLMEEETGNMILTDPPWNVDYGGSDHPAWKKRTILNDSMTSEQFAEFLTKAFGNLVKHTKPGAMTYIFMSAQEWGNIMKVMVSNGYHWSSTIIWKKDRLVLSRKDYHTQYEPIWYGWLEGAPRLCPLLDREQSDVWEFPKPTKSEEHPTMKPIELLARAIVNSSRADDIVIDNFGGSGSTLIAAEQVGRSCCMMELDPKYCDVIVKRWEQLTRKKAERIIMQDDTGEVA